MLSLSPSVIHPEVQAEKSPEIEAHGVAHKSVCALWSSVFFFIHLNPY